MQIRMILKERQTGEEIGKLFHEENVLSAEVSEDILNSIKLILSIQRTHLGIKPSMPETIKDEPEDIWRIQDIDELQLSTLKKELKLHYNFQIEEERE